MSAAQPPKPMPAAKNIAAVAQRARTGRDVRCTDWSIESWLSEGRTGLSGLRDPAAFAKRDRAVPVFLPTLRKRLPPNH